MIIELLKESDALLEGHFLLSSGKHSNKYIQCAKLLQYPDKAEKVVARLVEKIKGIEFDLVVGPALGGVIVSYEIGRQMGKPAFFTERENGEMKLKRGLTVKPGQRVLIAEDVVTTGKSSYETIDIIKGLGGKVVAIAALIDRTEGELRYPFFAAERIEISNYMAEDCPMCKEGLELVKPGSRTIKK